MYIRKAKSISVSRVYNPTPNDNGSFDPRETRITIFNQILMQHLDLFHCFP